jgi:hypothetical protein
MFGRARGAGARCGWLVATTLGLSILASALGSATASAGPPEFQLCKKFGGPSTHGYTTGTCKSPFVANSGKWERVPVPVGSIFKGKGRGSSHKNVIDPVRPPMNPAKIEAVTECETEKSEGMITGPKADELEIKYAKCEAIGHKCNSPSAPAGKIESKPLVGTLVYLNSAQTRLGVRFKPKTGDVLAEYSCGPITVKEEGEVIQEQVGQIESANKDFDGTLEEGPLRAQAWPYELQQGTEENELEYAEWEVPVAEGGKAGTPPFGWSGSAFVPAYVNALITGGNFAEGPSTQNSDTEYKGANILVEF